MLLAGDIGGTKTLLGLFDPLPVRPRPLAIASFATLDYGDLTEMIGAFVAGQDVRPEAISTACFGVAGPVSGEVADLTAAKPAISRFAPSPPAACSSAAGSRRRFCPR